MAPLPRRRVKEPVDAVPVHHRPPPLEVVTTLVLVLQIVGVLPNVVGQDRLALHLGQVHQGVVLVRRGDDPEPVPGPDQPHPARAEALQARLLERLGEGIPGAEVLIDPGLQRRDQLQLAAHRVADLLDPRCERRVGVLDPLQVFGPGRQFVIAARGEDDAGGARRAALIDRDEPLR